MTDLPFNQEIKLTSLLNYQSHRIKSRRLKIVGQTECDWTLFAFATGESVSAEKSASRKIFFVLEGVLVICETATGEKHLPAGALYLVEKDSEYSLRAEANCKFLEGSF